MLKTVVLLLNKNNLTLEICHKLQNDWEADGFAVKSLVVSIFDKTTETSAAPAHTNAWHTPSYTRDRSTVEQNMTHRRIISYPWCGWDGLNNLSAKWDRGRMGGERGQREDRCQMSVCKNKIKYRVEQRFGDTEVHFCQRWRERSCGCQVWYLVFAWRVWSPSDQIWALTDSFQRVNTDYTNFLYLGHTEETGLWAGPGVSDYQGLPEPLVQGVSQDMMCVSPWYTNYIFNIYNRILTIVTLSAIYGKKPLAKLLFFMHWSILRFFFHNMSYFQTSKKKISNIHI